MMNRLARIPLFWKIQIVGWAGHGVLSIPLKIATFGSVRAAVLFTVVVAPLGLVLTTLIRQLIHGLRLGLDRPVRLGSIALVCCAVAAAIDWQIAQWLQDAIQVPDLPRVLGIGFAWLRAGQYLAWVVLYFSIKSNIAARERAMNVIRAEAAASEAELRMLRAQIDPHFLFNSLNTVLAGLDTQPKAQAGVVQGLADYLRYSLANRHAALVPLGEEYDAILNYLVVEKARYREDLVIDACIEDDARAVPVPGVMLQPLVENAIKHGFRQSPVPLRLRIKIQCGQGGGALVEVANSGRWITSPERRGPGDASGVGLETLKRRLELLYQDSHRFDIVAGEDEVVVRIEVPSRSTLLQPA